MTKLNRCVYYCIKVTCRRFPNLRMLAAIEERYTRKLIKGIPLQGYIVSARVDGLMARINSIFNGVVISKYYQKPFLFTWVSPKTGKGSNKFSCISDQPSSFISQRFLEDYHVDEDIARKCTIPWHKSVAYSSLVTAKTIDQELSFDEFNKLMSEYGNLLANCQYTRGFNQSTAMNREIFEHFFSEEMKAKFRSIQEMRDWTQWITIHYRAGDVIYGNNRTGEFVRDRSLSLPVVEQVIRNHHTYNIVIMGTPKGDSLDELIYLERKYPNVELSPEIKFSSIEHNPVSTLCDSYLMSLCKKIVCAGHSNMTLFAQRLSDVEIYVPSKEEQKNAMEESLRSGEACNYTKLQQAFIHYNLFMIDIDDHSWGFEKLDGLLEKISDLDPENNPPLLLRFLLAKKYHQHELANRMKMEILRRRLNPRNLARYFKPSVLNELKFQAHLAELLAA